MALTTSDWQIGPSLRCWRCGSRTSDGRMHGTAKRFTCRHCSLDLDMEREASRLALVATEVSEREAMWEMP